MKISIADIATEAKQRRPELATEIDEFLAVFLYSESVGLRLASKDDFDKILSKAIDSNDARAELKRATDAALKITNECEANTSAWGGIGMLSPNVLLPLSFWE